MQDDIHVVPRLLLNVGLRYEYNSPPVEAQNRFSVPDLVSCAAGPATPTFNVVGTNGIPRATYLAHVHRFCTPHRHRLAAVEIGALGGAFRLRHLLRFFHRECQYLSRASIRLSTTWRCIRKTPLPVRVCCARCRTFSARQGKQSGVVQGNMISPKFRDGYMQQWNADLQYEVLPNWMVDMAYVGSKGTHLSDVLDRNQPDPVTGLPPYPQFSSILYVESNANSSYNSLQLRSEKRTSHGLALLLSYTYSKSFDDISSVFGGSVGSGLPQNSRDLPADRGPSDFNAVNRFSGSFVYDLPFQRLWAHGPAQTSGQMAGGRNRNRPDGIAFHCRGCRRAGLLGGGFWQSGEARPGRQPIPTRSSGRESKLPGSQPGKSAAKLVQSLRFRKSCGRFRDRGPERAHGPGIHGYRFLVVQEHGARR